MAIKRVEIKDFLVFKDDFAADFCPGVNVLIGENGTGKTILLKTLYWGCEFSNKSVLEINGNLSLGINKNTPFNSIFLLYSYFNQLNAENLVKYDYNSNIKLYSDKIFLSNYPVLDVSISRGLGSIQMHDIGTDLQKSTALAEWCKLKVQSVFIPVNEMLSHSRGFFALNRERPLPFDCTEMDIISKAELVPTRDITPNANIIINIISNVIDGNVIFDGKDFYIERKDGISTPFSFEASGFRKFGLLWKLLRNGLLEKDTVLFWDEPENSLNPELIPILVDILLELSRNGVQIFIATHSVLLADYFTVNRKNGDKLMFTSLYKGDGRIKANTDDRFDLLTPNKLTEEPVKLYERKLDRGFGGE